MSIPACDRLRRISAGLAGTKALIGSTLSKNEVAAWLAAIVESSDDAIISKDLDGYIRTWNKSAERIFGYSADEMVGAPIMVLIPEERGHEETRILEQVRRGERLEHYQTVRRRKDGRVVDISLTVSPILSEDGQVIGASKIARDISRQKEVERTKELLIQEIQHRVRNTLGTVQAIASQTFRSAPREERSAFVNRIKAVSRAHDLLTQSDGDGASIQDVVADTLAIFEETARTRFELHGHPVQLSPNAALSLALVLHELATNALKYGALSTEVGRVALRWELLQTPNMLRMEWQERGGPEVALPKRKGFGSNLMERAFDSGKVELDFAPSGLRATFVMRI